eukprot:TRINITY_DN20770_c0_g1_i2.p1 TRINITY_DN20770_c0_g1~~TRINITY_DN20770_c0_g1_i2.p1  ORF type:complete len:458 (+),score=98.57 TRINITY_DN20770_c0_g1_i2:47-1375(+)
MAKTGKKRKRQSTSSSSSSSSSTSSTSSSSTSSAERRERKRRRREKKAAKAAAAGKSASDVPPAADLPQPTVERAPAEAGAPTPAAPAPADDGSSDFGPEPAPMPASAVVTSAPAGADDDDDSDFGPVPAPAPKKRKRPVEFAKMFLDALPSQELYERSFMHRDTLSQVLLTPRTNYVVTCSFDGHLKWWKKVPRGIVFVKHYRPHMGPFRACVSADGGLVATCAYTVDRSIKVFEVESFDMINMIRIDFNPGPVCFAHAPNAAAAKLVVAHGTEAVIRIFDPRGAGEAVIADGVAHHSRIVQMAYNAPFDTVISVDAAGMIEYWDATTMGFPAGRFSFTMKMETDLWKLAPQKVQVQSISCSADGRLFALTAKNNLVYIYRFLTGKQHRVYDESLSQYMELQRSGGPMYPCCSGGRWADAQLSWSSWTSGSGLRLKRRWLR